MENIATDVISLLRYLLPGFLSAWIFYGFTSFKKPSQFERVVQALIFTLLIQPLVILVEKTSFFVGNYISLGGWGANSETITSVIVAIILGIFFAFFTNNDRFHKFFRKMNVTKETSYPSEWYGEFSNRVCYVVLHLVGGRRLYGWPKEWPSTHDKGHFSMLHATWLDKENKEIPLKGVEAILIPASEVKMVEFMEKVEEKHNG